VHYPREGHGLQEPNHRLDELRRSLAWMDRYLLKRPGSENIWRIGDRVLHPGGHLEMCVTRAEITTFIGRHDPKDEPSAEGLLVVAFTLNKLDPRHDVGNLTLALSDVLLEAAGAGRMPESALAPIGVPLEGPGGVVLVEGGNLRINLQSDPNTGELAAGASVVFNVPKSGEGKLRVADFPPVSLHWASDE